jgi:hypothetical protein
MRKTVLAIVCGGVLAAGSLFGAGCAADGDPVGVEVLKGLKLELDSANEGVYPDKSALTDPNNPFAIGTLSQDTVWEVQSRGGNVGAFYAWATLCARGCNGERQFYIATDLAAIYFGSQANPDQLPLIKANAIRGFQAVLDNFPKDVTYAADGVTTYGLATLSLKGILALGGKATGGWVLVPTDDGVGVAVQP